MKRTLFLLLFVALYAQQAFAQCSPGFCNPSGSCVSYGMFFYAFNVTGSTGSIADASGTAPCNSTGYLNRTVLSCTFKKGNTYTASITTGGSNNVYFQAWIDFNNDNVYQSSETVGYTSASFINTTTCVLTIPTSVPTATVKMRVALNWTGSGVQGPNMDPCVPCGSSYNYGEVREYTVNIIPPPPAVTAAPVPVAFGSVVVGGTPGVQVFTLTPADLTASPLTVTAPTDFKLSTDGISYSSALSIAYALPTVSATVIYTKFTPTTYSAYSSNITVTGGGLAATYNIPVTGIGAFPCTGTPSIGSASASPTSGNTSTPITLSVPPVTGVGGITYQWQSYTLSTGSSFTNIAGATNANYTLTAGIAENSYFRVIVSCISGGSVTSNIVPVTLSPAGTPCAGLPTAGTISSSVPQGCAPSYTANLFYSSADAASGLVYQWQSSALPSSGFSNIGGATNPYYTATVTATRYFQLKVTCTVSGGSAISNVQPLVFNPLPAAIAGNTNVCTALPSTLTDATGGGSWTSSNSSIAIVGLGTGLVSGVVPGLATITYTLPTGCIATTSVGVNNSPSSISGTTNVCAGSTVSLSDASAGGTWSSSDNALASANPATGVVTGVAAGAPILSYIVPTGCFATTPITVNPLPVAITGVTNVCVGGTTSVADATSGGTWSSSNSFQAGVDPSTGIVSGVAAGTPSVRYTLPTGCRISQAITVNALPAAITGASNVCTGGTTTLTDAAGTGTWNSSSSSIASINSGTGDISGLVAGTASISFTLTSTGCVTSAPITVNPLPTPFHVTGGGGYCPGSTVGVHVGIDASENGVDYQLYLAGTGAIGGTVAGTSSGMDFGLFTATGVYTVQATNHTSGCMNNMASSATVSLNTPPNDFLVSGGGGYCAGGSGVHVTMAGSDVGVNYQLSNGTTAVGSPVAGTGSGILDFGLQTMAGTYTVLAVNTTSLCDATMSGSAPVIISPVPAPHTVTGGGGYCSGDLGGVSITMDSSTGGVDYQLYLGGVATGGTVPGTGGLVTFTGITTPGVYTMSALDISNGCSGNMRGSVNVFINPLPAVYNVSGGGNYCTGGIGKHVGLNFSVVGTTYELFNSSVTTGMITAGSNAGLDFGLLTAPGSYTVMGTIAATGCTTSMAGTATIGVNALPTPYGITGGGPYCIGGTGVLVGVGPSDAGISYQLYKDGITVGTPVIGTGSAINFGLQTLAGSYTVSAMDAATLCTNMMTGSAPVSISNLPTAFNVGGGGAFCTGGTGANVTINNSTTGIDYQLYNGAATAGPSVPGTGALLDFGLQTTPGLYTVKATSAAGCVRTMNRNATISTLPLPAAYSVTGGGNYCPGSAGVHVGLAVSNSGVTYHLFNGATASGTLLGTGSALDFGIFSAIGTYTVSATNTATGCTNNMISSAAVIMNSLPTVYTVTGGGPLCDGGVGVPVDLSGSAIGIGYRLYNGSAPVGGMFIGTGSIINFGLQTVGGTYTVKAIDLIPGGCSQAMAASAVVTVYPNPTVYVVSGGGNYCAGGVGAHINMSGSDLGGFQYQIWNGTTPEGSFWAGTGRPLDLGAHTAAGTFKVVATNVLSGCTSNMMDSAIIDITPTVIPAVSILTSSPMHDTVCAANSTTFTVMSANGGTLPTYVWKVNGTPSGSGSSFVYSPVNGESVSVVMTTNAVCPASPTASDVHVMTVLNAQTPMVSVTVSPGAIVCPGVHVTYTAVPVSGGDVPTYSWKRNGVPVGSGSSYSYVAKDSDVIFAVLNSNFFCRTSSFAVSNNVVMKVDAPQFPSFTLQNLTGSTITAAHEAKFVAVVDNIAATAPSYSWKVNNTVVAGASNGTFTTSSLGNDDVVCAVVTGHNGCGASAPATHCETIEVTSNLGVTTVGGSSDIKVMPNPNKGVFAVKGTILNGNDEATLEVTNMLGQVVYSSKVAIHNGIINEQLQMNSNLANGMYLLNVRSGAEIKTIHFVIGQ